MLLTRTPHITSKQEPRRDSVRAGLPLVERTRGAEPADAGRRRRAASDCGGVDGHPSDSGVVVSVTVGSEIVNTLRTRLEHA